MNPIKVLFDSHHFETPEIFLNSILKMTPNQAGKWKNIEATLDYKEADFYLIMDGESQQWPDMHKKAIYFCEHPKTPYSPQHKTFAGKEALLKLPLHTYANLGEWWIPNTYDELMDLKPKKDQKDLICIMTYQTHHPMYAQRPKFMAELIDNYPALPLSLYGRPSDRFLKDRLLETKYEGVLGVENYNALKGEHIIGKEILQDFKYSIEFDVGPCVNYWSERFYDSLLLWTTPIYFGCINIFDYLPHHNKAYYCFDINDLEHIHHIPQIIKEPKYYKEIKEVREILLNKFQLWAYTHFIVNNIDSMINDPLKTYKEWING